MSAKEDAGSGTGVYVCVYSSIALLSEETGVKFMAVTGVIKVEANKADKDKQRE